MRKLNLKMIGAVPEPAIVRHFIPSGNYERVDTSRTVTVKAENVNLQWRIDTEGIGPGLMGLISKVKSEVKDREQKIKWPGKEESRVPYCRLQEFAGDVHAFEIDLSAAYVRAAEEIGAISKPLSRRLLQAHKRSRLVALGATATRRTITTFKNGKQAGSRFEQDPLGRRFFEALGIRVAWTMDKLRRAAGRDFIYYWADAIFVRSTHVLAVLNRARQLGVPVNDPTPAQMHIEGKLLHLADGRSFPARTLERNPFAGPAPEKLDGRALRQIVYASGKREELASPEDLKIIWDLARAGKTLTAEQGIQLYRSTQK